MASSSPRAKQATRASLWLGVALLAVGFLVQIAQQPIAADGLLRVRFLDVGQGDSILIDTPSGEHILIDGGPDDQLLQRLDQFVAPPRQFALVVASHNHADHITGLTQAIREFPTQSIWLSGAVHTSGAFAQWLETVGASGATVTTVQAGEERTVGGVQLRVLHPFEDFEGKTPDHQHDATVVLKLSYGATSFLLTGDLELDNERELLTRDRAALRADVLKVSHQGSKGSSTTEFLLAVDPEVAVISVGPNQFGHPHQETLDRLGELGIPVFRTDQDGTVTCTSNALTVSCS